MIQQVLLFISKKLNADFSTLLAGFFIAITIIVTIVFMLFIAPGLIEAQKKNSAENRKKKVDDFDLTSSPAPTVAPAADSTTVSESPAPSKTVEPKSPKKKNASPVKKEEDFSQLGSVLSPDGRRQSSRLRNRQNDKGFKI